MNENKIKQEAKQILDKFANALAKVEKEVKADSFVDREEFERMEGNGEEKGGLDFKKAILENAPESDNDFILTERGDWV